MSGLRPHWLVAARRAVGRLRGENTMRFPTYSPEVARRIREHADDVRAAHAALALRRLELDDVAGDLAEVGVYRGEFSQFLATAAPSRVLHLFDTFEGFPAVDLEPHQAGDSRFRETSADAVRRRLAGCNVVLHPGRFPETASSVADRTFAFVMLDLDLHAPTRSALEFFHPRLARGGFMFVHDYNSEESGHACRRAVDAFLRNEVERVIEIPDRWGSVVYRKIR